MATGYTRLIQDGVSFKNFTLNCARNFGALVSLRDEPVGTEYIPEQFKPSTYAQENLEKSKLELTALLNYSEERDITYYTKSQHEENVRTERNNNWITDLRESLSDFEFGKSIVDLCNTPTFLNW